MNKGNDGKKKYSVLVSIANKKYLPDPEGETILKDLILRGGFVEVEAVRLVLKMCAELRLYNPVVSKCVVTVTASSMKS